MALWEQIRSAIKAKGDTDITALRRASLGRPRRGLGGLPQLFVGIPSGSLSLDGRPNANTERYTLTFPGTLSVATPGGERRADTEAADLMYELLIAWRTGIKLGLGSAGVVGSWITSWQPDYDPDDLLLGYDLLWSVDVLETLNPGRTA